MDNSVKNVSSKISNYYDYWFSQTERKSLTKFLSEFEEDCKNIDADNLIMISKIIPKEENGLKIKITIGDYTKVVNLVELPPKYSIQSLEKDLRERFTKNNKSIIVRELSHGKEFYRSEELGIAMTNDPEKGITTLFPLKCYDYLLKFRTKGSSAEVNGYSYQLPLVEINPKTKNEVRNLVASKNVTVYIQKKPLTPDCHPDYSDCHSVLKLKRNPNKFSKKNLELYKGQTLLSYLEEQEDKLTSLEFIKLGLSVTEVFCRLSDDKLLKQSVVYDCHLENVLINLEDGQVSIIDHNCNSGEPRGLRGNFNFRLFFKKKEIKPHEIEIPIEDYSVQYFIKCCLTEILQKMPLDECEDLGFTSLDMIKNLEELKEFKQFLANIVEVAATNPPDAKPLDEFLSRFEQDCEKIDVNTQIQVWKSIEKNEGGVVFKIIIGSYTNIVKLKVGPDYSAAALKNDLKERLARFNK